MFENLLASIDAAPREVLPSALARIAARLLEPLAPPPPESTLPMPDLTVSQLASRYGRTPSAVRSWIESGRFAGAYKLCNREWRVPAADVTAFEAGEREVKEETTTANGPSLADWRQYRKGHK